MIVGERMEGERAECLEMVYLAILFAPFRLCVFLHRKSWYKNYNSYLAAVQFSEEVAEQLEIR